jgi:hypothetical protein
MIFDLRLRFSTSASYDSDSIRSGGKTVMSWIDDEAEKNRNQLTSEQREADIIRRSNLWARIVQQLRQDVDTINAHPHWKERLAGLPLRFEEIIDQEGGYSISKSGFPSVQVRVRNKGSRVVIERGFVENPLSKNYRGKEELKVAISGEDACLKTAHEDVLGVPEEATKFILDPIIESLKITRTR